MKITRNLLLTIFNNLPLSLGENIHFASNTKIEAKSIILKLNPIIKARKTLDKYISKDDSIYVFNLKKEDITEVNSEKLFKLVLELEEAEKASSLWNDNEQREFIKKLIAHKYQERPVNTFTISEEELGLNKNNIALLKVFDFLVKQFFIERETIINTTDCVGNNFYFLYRDDLFQIEPNWLSVLKPIYLRISFKIKDPSLLTPYYQRNNGELQTASLIISNCKVFCEDKNGYFQLNKHSQKIFIGKINTRTYKFLKFMSEPYLGIKKTTNEVFKSIRIDKDKTNSALSDSYRSSKEQIKIIKNTIKELQKMDGLRGKLNYKFENSERELRIDLR